MAIVVPAALALVLASRREGRGAHRARRWGDRLRGWFGEEGGPGPLVPLFIVLIGGAALVAGSRGGVVAVLGALLVCTENVARSPMAAEIFRESAGRDAVTAVDHTGG